MMFSYVTNNCGSQSVINISSDHLKSHDYSIAWVFVKISISTMIQCLANIVWTNLGYILLFIVATQSANAFNRHQMLCMKQLSQGNKFTHYAVITSAAATASVYNITTTKNNEKSAHSVFFLFFSLYLFLYLLLSRFGDFCCETYRHYSLLWCAKF